MLRHRPQHTGKRDVLRRPNDAASKHTSGGELKRRGPPDKGFDLHHEFATSAGRIAAPHTAAAELSNRGDICGETLRIAVPLAMLGFRAGNLPHLIALTIVHLPKPVARAAAARVYDIVIIHILTMRVMPPLSRCRTV